MRTTLNRLGSKWIESPLTKSSNWSRSCPDPIDQSLQDPAFTQRLPEVQGKQHDRSITHPKIPRGRPGSGSAAPPPVAAPQPGGLGRGGLGSTSLNRNAVDNADAKTPKIENKLFRFFDFSAQPGKSYRYRVRLVLRNPNHNVPAQYLTNAQLAKGETRVSPWSEPSDIVTIPRVKLIGRRRAAARPARAKSRSPGTDVGSKRGG